MSKIFGFLPQALTRQLIDRFEDEIVIRHNNQPLVGTVYVDMQPDRWAVAFAYNYTRHPGLHGHENPLEVKYTCPVQDSGSVRMFRSDILGETTLTTEPFRDADAFVRFALTEERAIAGRPL